MKLGKTVDFLIPNDDEYQPSEIELQIIYIFSFCGDFCFVSQGIVWYIFSSLLYCSVFESIREMIM